MTRPFVPPARFVRVSRYSPDGSPECTDIPGFYGRPVGMLHADKPRQVRPAVIKFAVFGLIAAYIINFLSFYA